MSIFEVATLYTMDNLTLAPMYTTPVYLQFIKKFQRIFAIFGLTLPPFLYFEEIHTIKGKCVYGLYAVYCAILCTWTIYAVHLHNVLIHEFIVQYQVDNVTEILSYIHNYGLVVMHGYVEVKTLWQYKDLQEILNLIEQLEYEIWPQDYRTNGSLKWKIFKISGFWLIFVIFNVMIVIILIVKLNGMTLLAKVLNTLLTTSLQLKCIEYSIYIQIIDDLIDSVRGTLKRLKAKIYVASQNPGNDWYLTKQLLKNQQLLNRVCSLVYKIDQYFAGPIVLVFCNSVLITLRSINWAYLRPIFEGRLLDEIVRFMFILAILSNLLIACYFAEKCMEKYRSIADLVHNFELSSLTDNCLPMRLHEYSLQLFQQNFKFSCNNFLDIDYRNFGKIILTIIAYVVIIVQFKMEDLSVGAKLATQKIFGNKV